MNKEQGYIFLKKRREIKTELLKTEKDKEIEGKEDNEKQSPRSEQISTRGEEIRGLAGQPGDPNSDKGVPERTQG